MSNWVGIKYELQSMGIQQRFKSVYASAQSSETLSFISYTWHHQYRETWSRVQNAWHGPVLWL